MAPPNATMREVLRRLARGAPSACPPGPRSPAGIGRVRRPPGVGPGPQRRPGFSSAIATASSADSFRQRVKAIGLAEVLATPRSPWQNPFAERVIGTIRRELLDHVIVLNERHLRRRLRNCLGYYHASRTHLALGKDAPEPRPVEPPERSDIVAVPQVGGLHHRYIRCAA